MSAAEPRLESHSQPATPPTVGATQPADERVNQASRRQELESRRERLTERFALLQSELGGLFYEMAIRDHLQLDLLIERAAALQRVEDELRGVDRELTGH